MQDADLPAELAGRWTTTVVLKRDVFSTVERGTFHTGSEVIPGVLRRIDQVPWWSALIARHFLGREARALAAAGELGIAPRLLYRGRTTLVRSWIDGHSLHVARPLGEQAYFRSCKAALRALHRAGVTHNDLAKEQNWLRTGSGEAMLTDFQLATRFASRSALFRLAAYEDLRHLLKHKRTYVPEALTPRERKVLARKSLPTRIWMATGKRVYYAITRGLLNFTDREGGGRRLVNDAPRIVAHLKAQPGVRDAAIVAFPDRRTGTGLYAFVAAEADMTPALAASLTAAFGAKAPERLQVVEALPRQPTGETRLEILQLIAMNQVDLVDALVAGDPQRELVDRIVSGRQNLRDRFAF